MKYRTITDHRWLSIKSTYPFGQFIHPNVQSQIVDLTIGKSCCQKRGIAKYIFKSVLFYFSFLLYLLLMLVLLFCKFMLVSFIMKLFLINCRTDLGFFLNKLYFAQTKYSNTCIISPVVYWLFSSDKNLNMVNIDSLILWLHIRSGRLYEYLIR